MLLGGEVVGMWRKFWEGCLYWEGVRGDVGFKIGLGEGGKWKGMLKMDGWEGSGGKSE